MARLLTRGFESGNLIAETDSIASSPFVNTGFARTGLYKFGTNSTSDQGVWNFPGADTIFMGVGFYIDDMPSNNNQDFLILASSNSTISLRAYVNGTINLLRSGAHLANSSPVLFTLDTYHYLELWVFMDNSGRAVLKMDGVTIIDFTGDTLASSDPNMSKLTLKGQQSLDIYYDDLVVNNDAGDFNNTWPGIVSLEPLFPTATGTVTQLSRGGADSGNNWDQVNEQPANSSEYVYSTATGTYDLYGLADFALPEGAIINNVILQGRSQIDSGEGKMRLVLESDSVEAESTGSFVLTTAWNGYSSVFEQDPSITGTWTDAAVDALQAGFKSQ